MNKNAIQRYAVWARTEMIAQVSQRAYQYEITPEGYGDINAVSISGRLLTDSERKQRQGIIRQIQAKGYTQAMEEVAYTWFNRFIALRFMEVNNYLPTHIRVFTDSSGAFKPEILTQALHLDLPNLDMDKVAHLIEENQTEDLYRYLLLTQCNALNSALPRMFEPLGSYTELLLPNNILRQDGVIGRMVSDIPEEDWTDQIQIIGWLYQYYNAELKDETFALLKKNIKVTKERLPSATQLFTPDWIVRYMVENSLGRLWIEGHPDEELKAGWKYYLDEAEQEPAVQTKLEGIWKESRALRPQDITVIDPCMGSGHILVYAFDVLVQIYKRAGYSERDAAQSILKNNIYGLDIDERAAQLAYFAVMMKARQYDRRIFSRDIQPQLYSTASFSEGRELGSLLLEYEIESIHAESDQLTLYDDEYRVRDILGARYRVVVTNPPYMAVSNADARVQEYVKKNFQDSKADLFAVFIERCRMLTEEYGFQAMITQHSWMFLSSFEKLREKLQTMDTVCMAHLGPHAFEEIGGEVVQTTSFVLRQSYHLDYQGTYCRLIEPTTQQGKEDMFLAGKNRFIAKQSSFIRIPGSPMAYWAGKGTVDAFKSKQFQDYFFAGHGLLTGHDEGFIFYWYEISYCNISFNSKTLAEFNNSDRKFCPLAKGGDFRKWYGNLWYVIWYNEAGIEKMSCYPKFTPQNQEFYFKKGITWTEITSGSLGARYMPNGCVFSHKGPSAFSNTEDSIYQLMGFMGSKVANHFTYLINPTITCSAGVMKKVPIIQPNQWNIDIVKSCVLLSKSDWDSFEISWDFQHHPLTRSVSTLDVAFAEWKQECEARFQALKFNEEELNRIFIGIYGLEDELFPEVKDKDVTVRRADLGRDIRSLISYAVGCMFGRYSLDTPGLAYAGGDWDTSRYSSFIPVADNIIPICDDEYFEDDITGLFVKWVQDVYGSEKLDENLKFIADALGGKGTPREVIRNYFLNGFYADHLKVYQKRPIYWLFDSGKKNGFKALIYTHRYRSDLLACMRTDYVHEQQERYRTQLRHIGDAIGSASGAERIRLTKQQKKLQEQSLELQKYEEKIHHLADQNIKIDLDDGVVHNYEIFSEVLAKRK